MADSEKELPYTYTLNELVQTYPLREDFPFYSKDIATALGKLADFKKQVTATNEKNWAHYLTGELPPYVWAETGSYLLENSREVKSWSEKAQRLFFYLCLSKEIDHTNYLIACEKGNELFYNKVDQDDRERYQRNLERYITTRDQLSMHINPNNPQMRR